MADLKVTGKITKVLPTQHITSKDGSKEWDKKEFVLETDEEWNSLYCFELFGQKLDDYGELLVADNIVTVNFQVKTNEWKGKYFTSLGAWKVEVADNEYQPDPQTAQAPSNEPPMEIPDDGGDDSLPF